jgi:FkbM family methyltransferase
MISVLKKINANYQIKTKLRLVLKSIFLSCFCLRKASWWSAIVTQDLNQLSFVAKDDETYSYLSINPLLLWRAQTLFSKEPETIQWFRSMQKGDVLFDVGANVGMYSIYAGIRGMRVFSFEPEASNYFILNQNIMKNELSSVVTAYNFALSDSEAIDVLKLTSFVPGSAHTTFGDNEAFKQTNAPTVFSQGAFSTTLDNLIYKNGLPVPDHLKIDVDGIEAKILKGAEKLLRDPKLKSILIEINESMPEDILIKEQLISLGFKTKLTSAGGVALKGGMVLKDYVFARESVSER